MSKKVLSIVLSVVMLMSVCVVGASAAITNYENAVKWTLVCGDLGKSKTDAQMAQAIAEYEAADPEVWERNLYFWDQEIIDAYHNASTNTEWKALYNEMRGSWREAPSCVDLNGKKIPSDELVDFYPAHLDNSKGTVEITYSTDVDYAKPGDVITVTLSAKTNFYFNAFQSGIIYDKTKLEFIEGSSNVFEDEANGWQAAGSEIPDYGITNTGTDQRSFSWPIQWRENKNGEYDKWGMVKRGAKSDLVAATRGECPFCIILPQSTPMFSFQFKVKDGVADGEKLDFFSVENTYRTINELVFYESIGTVPVLNEIYRNTSPSIKGHPCDVSEYDYTWTFNKATVTVGEEPTSELADYTALDAAIAAFDDTNAADYTAATWNAYADAVKAGQNVSRDLLSEDQAIVDVAAKAITDAKAALAKNAVKSAVVAGTPVIGANATVKVTVDGAPALLRFKNGENFLTFNADSEDVTVTDNGDGTQTWAVKVFADAESTTYEVYAKYANYTDDYKTVTINATAGLDLSIHSIVIPDMYPDAANGGTIVKGKHKIIITTSTDVYKIQFVDPKGTIESGSTYTYAIDNVAGNCSYVDNANGERVWTITHSFGPMGNWSMPIRTRAESTTFATTGDALTARVVY